MNRAYSVLQVKKLDATRRTFSGWATTPALDRMSDTINPLKATFKNPVVLLHQHRSESPIGSVTFKRPTKDGIEFEAEIPVVEEPGTLKDRVDTAWGELKHGLIRGVSIGFYPKEPPQLNDEGGFDFGEIEIFELSTVSVPANASATITTIKSLDRIQRAATGRKAKPSPDASGTKTGNKEMAKSTAEKIREIEDEIEDHKARMAKLLEDTEEEEREMTEDEEKSFDNDNAQVKVLQKKVERLKAVADVGATAKPVKAEKSAESASASRAGKVPAEAKSHEEKGLGFARLVMSYAQAKGNAHHALEIVKNRYPTQKDLQTVLKAQVAGGTTQDPSWAAPLVEPTNLVSEFVEFLRPQTIIGKFGAGGIPGLRRVPFNIKVPTQTSGGEGYWTGEGQPKKLTRFNFGQISLRWTKVANIAVLSEDLLRFSTPSAELLVRNSLADALLARLDSDFVNPSITESPDVRPASVTNGAQTYVASGVTAAAVRTDIKKLVSYFIVNDIPTTGVVLLMRNSQALSLQLMRNDLGQREFPDITMNGGMLEGLPVIASQYVPQGVVAAVSADNIYLADDGGVSIDMSREASLEMADDPTNAISDLASPPVSVEASMVSMFQTNSVAIRAERVINWKRRRAAAVAYLTSTGWGNEDTSPPQAAI